MRNIHTACIVLVMGICLNVVEAAITINIKEENSNVVMNFEGSVNTADFGDPEDGLDQIDGGSVIPNDGLLIIGGENNIDAFAVTLTSESFGSGDTQFSADSNEGDSFAVAPNEVSYLILPDGYNSEENISGSSTYLNTTLSGLGISPGSYTWTWGTGSNQDSATMTAVPEPAITSLAFSILLGIGIVIKGRRYNHHKSMKT